VNPAIAAQQAGANNLGKAKARQGFQHGIGNELTAKRQ
jgi:hypothetical protein